MQAGDALLRWWGRGLRGSRVEAFWLAKSQAAWDVSWWNCVVFAGASFGGIDAERDFAAGGFGLVGLERVGQWELCADNRANPADVD